MECGFVRAKENQEEKELIEAFAEMVLLVSEGNRHPRYQALSQIRREQGNDIADKLRKELEKAQVRRSAITSR